MPLLIGYIRKNRDILVLSSSERKLQVEALITTYPYHHLDISLDTNSPNKFLNFIQHWRFMILGFLKFGCPLTQMVCYSAQWCWQTGSSNYLLKKKQGIAGSDLHRWVGLWISSTLNQNFYLDFLLAIIQTELILDSIFIKHILHMFNRTVHLYRKSFSLLQEYLSSIHASLGPLHTNSFSWVIMQLLMRKITISSSLSINFDAFHGI